MVQSRPKSLASQSIYQSRCMLADTIHQYFSDTLLTPHHSLSIGQRKHWGCYWGPYQTSQGQITPTKDPQNNLLINTQNQFLGLMLGCTETNTETQYFWYVGQDIPLIYHWHLTDSCPIVSQLSAKWWPTIDWVF